MAKAQRTLSFDAVVYAAGSLLSKGAKFLLIPIYVRFLTQAEVGMLVFLEALIVALSRVLSGGLAQAVKRFYIDYDDPREADAFTASVWWASLGLALVGGAGLYGAVQAQGHVLSAQVLPRYLALAVIAAALQGNFNVPLHRYIVRKEPLRHGLFTLFQFLTTTGLILFFVVRRGWGLDGVLWGYILGYGVWTLVAGAVIMAPARFRVRWGRMREVFAYALPALPHALFTWGISFADRVILERFVSLEALGIYGIGYQLASVLPVFSLALGNAWLARFFRSASSGEGPRRYARTLTRVYWAVVFLMLGAVAYAPEAIALVTTPAYAESATILRIVVLGLVFHGVYQMLLLPLFYTKDTRLVSLATGTAFAANVALNLLLVPTLGIYAAAWATLVAYGVATLIAYASVQHTYPVSLEWKRLAYATCVAAGVGAGLLSLPNALALAPMAAKLLVLAVFPLALVVGPYGLAADERAALRRVVQRSRREGAVVSSPSPPDVPSS